MIYIGIGSNMATTDHATPHAVCLAAVERIAAEIAPVSRMSGWYRTAPVPVSDQPWFVNGVVELGCDLEADAILSRLHQIEDRFGRVRRVRNEARVLDLDLLDWHHAIQSGPPVLPHPRLHERAFVLYPMRDIVPGWWHPVTGLSIEQLIENLPDGQAIERFPA